MLTLKGPVLLAALILLSSCQTIPNSKVYTVPSFPLLSLSDHPDDPKGFCLSSEEAAKLGLYIHQLENIIKEH